MTVRTWLKRAAAVILFAIPAAILYRPPQPAQAQTGGSTQLATVVRAFTFALAANATTIPISGNIGQTSHLIRYSFSGVQGCHFWFDGSFDNTNWQTLAAGSDAFNLTQVVQANGYFPYLRIKGNPTGQACNGETLSGTYTGSQVPLPLPQGFTANTFTAVTAPATSLCALKQGCNTGVAEPFIVGGFSCYNGTAAVAFVHLYDATGSPPSGTGLASGLMFVAGIPATSSYTYPGNPMIGHNGLWILSATAYGGSTGAAVNCTVSLNGSGPFFPLFPPSA
jgi:hypothetical protein